MSITVVSTPPMPTPGTVTDSVSGSGGDASAAQDFANLLLGQLAGNAEQAISTTDIPIAAAEQPLTSTTTTEATPVDAASLLLALGLAATPADTKPADVKPSGETAAKDAESEVAPADAAASVLAALGLVATPAEAPVQTPDSAQQKADEPLAAASGTAGASPLTTGQNESPKNEPAVAATSGTDDKAAKFAVAAPAKETAFVEPVASDTPAATIVQPSSNAPSHANHVDTKSDSALPVTTHLRDKAWATDLGQKVVWLASNEKQSAQLTLNPPQMGPIEVSLNIDKGNASVSFASANAEVRDAIETALPKLREMFASAGIELGQTNVGAQSFSQQQAWSGEQNQSSSRWMSDNAILGADTTGALQTGELTARQGNGMVDIFA